MANNAWYMRRFVALDVDRTMCEMTLYFSEVGNDGLGVFADDAIYVRLWFYADSRHSQGQEGDRYVRVCA